jgi:hypothetical protein
MKAHILLLAGLIPLLLAGCTVDSLPSRLSQYLQGGETIPFETIALEDWGGPYPYEEPRMFLLTTEESVNEIADFVSAEDLLKLHQVNYATHAVIAVFRGVQPGSKHDVIIQRVLRQDDIVITVVALYPEPRGGETAAAVQTSPYHLVKIAKDNQISAQTQLKLQITTGSR